MQLASVSVRYTHDNDVRAMYLFTKRVCKLRNIIQVIFSGSFAVHYVTTVCIISLPHSNVRLECARVSALTKEFLKLRVQGVVVIEI